MFTPSYSYDDIGLVPQMMSTIDSRDECDVTQSFLGLRKKLPILIAPMESAVDIAMVKEAARHGVSACSPRGLRRGNSIPTVSVKNTAQEYDINDNPDLVCLDTANGYAANVEKAIQTLRDLNKKVRIITGNVGSLAGFTFLNGLEVNAVRVGIGNGSVCSTSIATGVGMGQATLVRQIAKWREVAQPSHKTAIIADGGIWTAGHVSKAIAATKESPGDVVKFQGRLYKQHKGQASFAVKRSQHYVEGDDTLVPLMGTVEEVLERIKDGLRSAMAYMNARDLNEFRYYPDHYFTLLSGAAHRERGIYA